MSKSHEVFAILSGDASFLESPAGVGAEAAANEAKVLPHGTCESESEH